ncbi:hypothetical protein KJ786_00040 [Patescibacteria group bacterium]|nr:hypothetical protein [Patescibacteria group bacterium]
MKQNILKDQEKYAKQEFKYENNLTSLFIENYKNIISENSFFIKLEKQVKSKNFKNFKHSISDGYLLIWDKPTTPSLYITEIELERHDMNKHILPQIGNFISFKQSATPEELNTVRNYLYQEINRDKSVLEKLQRETGKEVYKLLDDAMGDLQILLVLDRISPELSIGLSQIEKAINVKIRKIEVSLFTKDEKKVVLFSDSDITDEDVEIPEDKLELEEYTLAYHIENMPEKISSIVNAFSGCLKMKGIKEVPTKYYIGFFKNKNMIFSCVVRKNSVIFYSKATLEEIKPGNYNLSFRDVRNIGHYTNHLPTEIVLTELNQIDDLQKYFDEVYRKY